MSLVAYSPEVRNDATALLRFSGPANTLVTWSVESGPGSVSGLAPATDATGTAYAVYDPEGGSPGTAVLRATYGT